MMGAVDDSERLIELIASNDDIAHHADGCDAATLTAAESAIEIAFPPSYRRLVEEFGTFDIAGVEILGVYQTQAMGETLLGSVIETLDARRQYGLPSELIVVMFDGMGGLIVLDGLEPDIEGEYPVRVWSPGGADRGGMEQLGTSFGSYALDLCQRAVTRWREST
jgi:antitoxin YobK